MHFYDSEYIYISASWTLGIYTIQGIYNGSIVNLRTLTVTVDKLINGGIVSSG